MYLYRVHGLYRAWKKLEHSISDLLLLVYNRSLIRHMFQDIWFPRLASSWDCLTHFSAVLITTTKIALLRVPKIHITAGLISDWSVVEYTHVEYCDMFLILGSLNIRYGTNARTYALHHPGRRHPGAIVFRWLQKFLGETPKACVGEHRWRIVQTPANDYAIISAVEKAPLESSHDMRYSTKAGTVPCECLKK